MKPLKQIWIYLYNHRLAVAHEWSGLHYKTGPRRGQQLADQRTRLGHKKLMRFM